MKGNRLRILIVGTGNMANSHAARFAEIPGVQLAGAVDSRPEVLAEFCRKFGIRKQFTDLQAALDWGKFDAVTNVTPDAVHYATTMQALAAGKHVLCEKPLATDYALAGEMRDTAVAAGVINMVNLSYRNVPALQQAARLVAEGAIGTVRHFDASYLQSWLTQPAWGDWRSEATWLWRLSTLHGSKGVLGDIGIHILDFATFVARSPVSSVSCRLTTFNKSEGGRIGDYILDANDSFAMHLQLADGAIGTVSATRFASGHHNDLKLRIYGDLGGLEVGFEKGVSSLRGCLGPEAMLKAEWQEIDCPPVATVYERFVAAIRGVSPAEPDFARGAELQQVLDLADRSSHDDCRSLPMGQIGIEEAALVG